LAGKHHNNRNNECLYRRIRLPVEGLLTQTVNSGNIVSQIIELLCKLSFFHNRCPRNDVRYSLYQIFQDVLDELLTEIPACISWQFIGKISHGPHIDLSLNIWSCLLECISV